MKKLYTTNEYKLYHTRHCIRESSRKIKSKRKRSFKISHIDHSRGNNPNWINKNKVSAPNVFCIKENPQEVVRFINKLNRYLETRTPVFIDLSRVEYIAHDAIVVLLSILSLFKKRHVDFNGNFPADEKCCKILRDSGFFSNLYETQSIKYDTSIRSKNDIRKHGKEASGEVAKDLIAICTQNIWGQKCRCQGVYRILIELMQNTHAHASHQAPGVENWWLAVNYDPVANKECFSFVDYGIGVFTSLEGKKENEKFYGMIKELRKRFIEPNNAKVLKCILDGDLHKTSTGESYRGKGLPGIKQSLERNQISNLYIITNDAYANVNESKFITLSHAFNGTFIYWELTDKNIRCYD